MSAHVCHYCKTAPCPPKHLCCAHCWSFVPARLSKMLYAAFDPAQCSGRGPRPLPTGEWMLCADACLIKIGLGKGLRDQGPARFDLLAVNKLTRAGNYAVAASDDMTSDDVTAYLDKLADTGNSQEWRAVFARAISYGPWPVDLRERGLIPNAENIAAFAPVI